MTKKKINISQIINNFATIKSRKNIFKNLEIKIHYSLIILFNVFLYLIYFIHLIFVPFHFIKQYREKRIQ